MAQFKPIRIGDTVPLQQINPATEEIEGKIYVSQSGVVLGRATSGDGPHEEIPFGDLPGGPGGASYTEVTYSEMQALIAANGLTPGGWYLITDAQGSDLGFLTNAVTENQLNVSGVAGNLYADFQGGGDYSGTPETFGTQLGIWRTGFEQIQIAISNSTPDYVEYTTSSGLLTDGETFTTDLGTTGTVIHDDGSVVTLQFPSQALVAGEVITGDTSSNTVTVDAYYNPVFVAGDTITGGTTGATATVVSFDEIVGVITAYMTSPGVAFDGSEALDNGSGVTADQDGAATSPTIVQGDVVIWNLTHYQLTDAALLDGTDPATNTAAYTALAKGDYPETYITAWDVSEFDFSNNWIQYRQDLKGNEISYNKKTDEQGQQLGYSLVTQFQFGKENVYGNTSIESTIIQPNAIFGLYSNQLFNGYIAGNTGTDSGNSISGCTIISGSIYDCVFAGGTIVGFVIYGGYVANGNIKSTLSNFTLYSGASVHDFDFGSGASVSGCVLNPDSSVNNIFAQSVAIQNNILENGASLTGITAGAGCIISGNKIEATGTLGGSMVLGDGAQVNNNTILLGIEVSNKTFDPGVLFNGNTIGVTMDVAETISDNIENKRAIPGFSDVPGTIDITGLSALDFTAAWAQYRGFFNLTSGNATETIGADSLLNFPTLFPFRITPAAGLTLTLTCTPAASATAGSIVGSTGAIVLNGDNGDFVELETDPTLTFVRVKNIQIYS